MTDPMEMALARLDRALEKAGHPLPAALRPGLAADVIRELMVPTGLTLPDEAAALWRWHNGLEPSFTAKARQPGAEMLPGGALFLALGLAVETYLWHREHYPWTDLDDLSPGWFPAAMFGHGAIIWIDCSAAPGEPASAVLLGQDERNPPEEVARRTLASLVDGVSWWASLLEWGQWVLRQLDDGGIWTFVDDPEPHPWIQ